MWLKWLPWRYLVRRAARAHGFLDPLTVVSQLERFAQPSEVLAPLELVRAGVVFHARGLMNTGAIQHNLDWVWPYWVERQFDPRDDAFIPRAFSITHVNLTHRNWTAVGVPDCDWFPIVDPRGLLTPFWDSWSLDAWMIDDQGRRLIPSQSAYAKQTLEFDDSLAVVTECPGPEMVLRRRAAVEIDDRGLVCVDRIEAAAEAGGWLAVVLRPANPEGVSFIHEVGVREDRRGWQIEGFECVQFNLPPDRYELSSYREGDVYSRLPAGDARDRITCDVGMATAAALFRVEPDRARNVEVHIAQWAGSEPVVEVPTVKTAAVCWQDALQGAAPLEVPNARYQFLYEAALRTLILHTPEDAYPGPYTYKRFWFRDAAFIVHGLLCAGLLDRARRVLDRFPLRQDRNGYFHSQEGEWDSNGQVLWVMHRYCQMTGSEPSPDWQRPIQRAAEWIVGKRLADDLNVPHAGLLPSGFSAEHLGPSDFYYWDDFWSVAGLEAAAEMLEQYGDPRRAATMRQEAERLMQAIQRSIEALAESRGRTGVPASPYRRMDAGAIGSIVVGYPLQLWEPTDSRLLDSVEFLLEHCFLHGGFFQDMIHSGINAYLTLHVAQILMRAGDARAPELIAAVANLASPTGQWPEAIHPRTLGGCMGDGQHVWAALEWVAALRNSFVREEGDRLIVGAGLPTSWLEGDQPLRFGPAPTCFGPIKIEIDPDPDAVRVRWHADCHRMPRIEVRLASLAPIESEVEQGELTLSRAAVA